MLTSVALALEYEATSSRPENLYAANASEFDVVNPIDAVVDVTEPVGVHYQWRPWLLDAGDEMVSSVSCYRTGNAGTPPSQFGQSATM